VLPVKDGVGGGGRTTGPSVPGVVWVVVVVFVKGPAMAALWHGVCRGRRSWSVRAGTRKMVKLCPSRTKARGKTLVEVRSGSGRANRSSNLG